jgi:hypothetical protein
MFLLYHSDGCNTSETVFYWCYVNDLHTTHAVVCWVTALSSHHADEHILLLVHTPQPTLLDNPMTPFQPPYQEMMVCVIKVSSRNSD